MNVDSPLRQMLQEIQHADMTVMERELLRPALAAVREAKVIKLPDFVVARIRHIHARMPKS